jgi:cellulose synthase/poly-beta-1,6-N-acetylglucosamine synthase-like glycosyltransferase
MNRKPRVSVIIPCYNYAHFLGEAIESVLGQTFRYFSVKVTGSDGALISGSEEIHYKFKKKRGDQKGLL